ncbi:MAG: DUF2029 domain-containing protein [Gemmatimonadota bacterium]|nr:DUF2029 domain-containing protein [Gemmatimonadota bacterium]
MRVNDGRGGGRRCERLLIALYLATAALIPLQRGVWGPQRDVFKIFRQSFWHLVEGHNLYGAYPFEQGAGAADLFKYSPTAALLFAPLAPPSYAVALFAWSLLGAGLLWYALTRVLPRERAVLAAMLLYPDLLASLQACSSNAVIAASIILTYVALERGHQLRAAAAVVAGAAMKLFPLAALTFALFHRRRRRFALVVAVVAAVALLLPLAVTSPALLTQQYRWWYALELRDAADLLFGASVMQLVRGWVGGTWPNWPLQLAGTAALLLPLVVRRDQWRKAEFRLHYLALLLVYAVLFNHQAERASFVMASAGVAIWCVTPPARVRHPVLRATLAVLALVGLGTIPLALVWLAIQTELYGWGLARVPLPCRASVGAPTPTHHAVAAQGVPAFGAEDASAA